MKDEERKLVVFVLASLFHTARIISGSIDRPSSAFDSAEAFLAEANKRGVLPNLPG